MKNTTISEIKRKLSCMPLGYTLIVIVDHLNQTRMLAEGLNAKEDGKLFGSSQTIYYPGIQKSIKFMTIDTVGMQTLPLFKEEEFEKDNTALDKDISDFFVLDLEEVEESEFDAGTTLTTAMAIFQELRRQRDEAGKPLTYELSGIDEKDLPLIILENKVTNEKTN